jgi:tRNA(Ile)-lysidine synthase TilS/MesJ
VREKEILRFARAASLPVVPQSCERGRDSRRVFARELVRRMERENPKVKINLLRAGLRAAQRGSLGSQGVAGN